MTDKVDDESKAPQEEPTPENLSAISLDEARASVEALLYASADPLPTRSLKKAIAEAPELVAPALQSLQESYEQPGRGLQLVEVAGGWQITTRPEYHERVGRLFDSPRPPRLSLQALETLAVIAYRQPATVPEIIDLRGVRSASVVRTLLERKLVKIVGRKKVVGLPLLYGTTKEFLVRFGLKSLKGLPQLRDMSEVFGDEVAEQLEVLDTLDQAREPFEIEPLETEPLVTEPLETEPLETEPLETEPLETEPLETEPLAADDAVTEAPSERRESEH